MNLISIGKAATMIGVSQRTLINWEKEGKIKAIHLPKGHRRYDQDYLLNEFCGEGKENDICQKN